MLTLVNAWSVPAAAYASAVGVEPTVFEDEGHAALERAIADVPDLANDRALAQVAVQADPGAALVKAAADADLLVVGSRGHGGFLGLLLGSVSHWCANHATCPVAVVPATWDGDHARRVVVGVDGSAPSYEALRWAIDEAAHRGVELDVVHGYGYQQLVSPYGAVPGLQPDEARAAEPGHDRADGGGRAAARAGRAIPGGGAAGRRQRCGGDPRPERRGRPARRRLARPRWASAGCSARSASSASTTPPARSSWCGRARRRREQAHPCTP